MRPFYDERNDIIYSSSHLTDHSPILSKFQTILVIYVIVFSVLVISNFGNKSSDKSDSNDDHLIRSDEEEDDEVEEDDEESSSKRKIISKNQTRNYSSILMNAKIMKSSSSSRAVRSHEKEEDYYDEDEDSNEYDELNEDDFLSDDDHLSASGTYQKTVTFLPAPSNDHTGSSCQVMMSSSSSFSSSLSIGSGKMKKKSVILYCTPEKREKIKMKLHQEDYGSHHHRPLHVFPLNPVSSELNRNMSRTVKHHEEKSLLIANTTTSSSNHLMETEKGHYFEMKNLVMKKEMRKEHSINDHSFNGTEEEDEMESPSHQLHLHDPLDGQKHQIDTFRDNSRSGPTSVCSTRNSGSLDLLESCDTYIREEQKENEDLMMMFHDEKSDPLKLTPVAVSSSSRHSWSADPSALHSFHAVSSLPKFKSTTSPDSSCCSSAGRERLV